jgi:hypothetical protein
MDIVEAILDGLQPAELRLDDLLHGFPLDWEGQQPQFLLARPKPSRYRLRQ